MANEEQIASALRKVLLEYSDSPGVLNTSATLSAVEEVDITKFGGTAVTIGQQLAASSLPVVLTAAQLTSLTPLTTLPTVTTVTTVSAVTSITNALPVGANVIGKVGIDQTTPGTTNAIRIASDQPQLAIPFATSPMIVSGTATFTRPADTTAYAVSDVVANSTTQASVVISSITLARGNSIPFRLKNVRIMKSTNVTTNASFNLYVFNATVTGIADNAQWTMLNADKAKYAARIGLTMFTEGTGSTGCMAEVNNLDIPIISTDSKLYLVLVAAAAYTPGNAEVFDIYVDVEQQ